MTRRGGMAWIAAGTLMAATAYVTVISAFPRAGSPERAEPASTAAPGALAAPAATVAPAASAATVAPAATVATIAPAAQAVAVKKVPDADAPAPPARTGGSPLRNSPGYVPPADPESASVRLGRREAPEVPDLFQGGAGSLEEFGRSVVAALNARDEKALHALRVTRGEFEKILWREFPESRPITRITAEDAWSMSEPRSLSGASRAVGLHGGRRLRFLTIESARVQTFTNFLLHRDVVVAAVDEGTAEIHRITLAPSVAERKGRFKALLYRD